MSELRLANTDCLPVLRDMPADSVDLVVTDPPYHIVPGGCTNDKVKIGRYAMGGVLDRKQKNIRQGKIFEHNHIEFSEWMPEVYRVLKPGAHCYIMINPRNLKELWQSAESAGFTFQNLLVWDKGNATPNKWYMNAFELILMLRKGRARNINNMGTQNILRVPNIMRTKKHPTEKPADLMQVLVENSTNRSDVVLDPFMGVGGVGVACRNTGRGFIGIEIDGDYFKIAEQRITGAEVPDGEEITGQIKMF